MASTDNDVNTTDTTMNETGASASSLQLVAQLPGHSDRAWGLAWNPTMPLLASCSSDRDVRLFQFSLPSSLKPEAGAEQLKPLSPAFHLHEVIPTGHRRTVRSVAWAPSGRTLATASFDSTVGIWERISDVMSAVKASESDGRDSHRQNGAAPSSSPQQHTTSSSSSSGLHGVAGDGEGDGEQEWDCIGTLEGHDNECKAVSFSHDGNLLASCSRDKSVWIWEVQQEAEFDCLSVLMEHSQDVKYVAWHPREELLASASYDDTIRLFIDDPSEDWFCYAALNGHTSTVWSLSFSPCGTFLASASEDQTVRIWRRLEAEQAEERGLKAYGKLDGTRKGDRWICVRILKGFHTRSVYSVSWGHPDRTAAPNALGRLATTGADGSICIFDVTENASGSSNDSTTSNGGVDVLAPTVTLLTRIYNAHGDADVNCVCWAPDKLKPLTERSLNDELRIRELTHKDQAREDALSASQAYALGNLLASSADDGSVKVWQFSS